MKYICARVGLWHCVTIFSLVCQNMVGMTNVRVFQPRTHESLRLTKMFGIRARRYSAKVSCFASVRSCIRRWSLQDANQVIPRSTRRITQYIDDGVTVRQKCGRISTLTMTSAPWMRCATGDPQIGRQSMRDNNQMVGWDVEDVSPKKKEKITTRFIKPERWVTSEA